MILSKNKNINQELLEEKLEAVFQKYNRSSFIDSDPIGIVHEYKETKDQELAAFISSTFAFGNVTYIRRVLKKILKLLGKHPAEALLNMSYRDKKLFKNCNYRWINSDAIQSLIFILSSIYKKYGSLENCFLKEYKEETETLRDPLIHFRNKLMNESRNLNLNVKTSKGLHYLLPDPSKSSACKRFNLFLRWVIRPSDGVDLGLWRSIKTKQLTIPLDTHIAKICFQIGLTKRKAINYMMAEDITNSLRKIDPIDPIRFDFAISRLGILRHCPKKKVIRICCECPIKEICVNWERN